MNSVFIYVLKCPVTEQIRYVGKTRDPIKRRSSHLRDCRNKNHRTNWIRSLLDKNLKPIFQVIDEVEESVWPQWEVAYIQFFRESGFNLVNGNAGGEGGGTPSSETRAKMSASASARRHLPLSEAHKRAIGMGNKGKKRSEETCAKLSAAHKGKPSPKRGVKSSVETCRRISLSQTGKKRGPMSEENRAKMRIAHNLRWLKIKGTV